MTTTTERNSQPTRTQLVDSAISVQDVLRKRLADSDIHRRQTDEVIDALTDAGFFRLWKPRRFGGYPADVRTVLQVTETLAEPDGSATWVVGIANSSCWNRVKTRRMPMTRSTCRASVRIRGTCWRTPFP